LEVHYYDDFVLLRQQQKRKENKRKETELTADKVKGKYFRMAMKGKNKSYTF